MPITQEDSDGAITKVTPINTRQRGAGASSKFAGGGNGGDNGGMETRVTKLEDFALDTRERLTRIETRLDTFATKADLHDMTAQMVKWIVGTAIGLGVAGITVMTFVLNNASPRAAGPAAMPPIIINVPGSPPAPPLQKQ